MGRMRFSIKRRLRAGFYDDQAGNGHLRTFDSDYTTSYGIFNGDALIYDRATDVTYFARRPLDLSSTTISINDVIDATIHFVANLNTPIRSPSISEMRWGPSTFKAAAPIRA